MAHLAEQPELPSRRSEIPIPASLEWVMIACRAKNPNGRPQSAAELRTMLDACTDVPQWSQSAAERRWALHRPDAASKAVA